MPELGLALSSRAGFPASQYGTYAGLAERAGFTAVFATETASDAVALAQAMAPATSGVRIGTAVANLYLRHPALLAMTAAAVDEVSGGRFVLGLGTANPEFNHTVLGLPETPVLATVEEYVETLRRMFAAGSADFAGSAYRIQGLELYRPPERPVPIYLGALLPRMLQLAGRIADGVILHLASPDSAAAAIGVVGQAGAEVGRDSASVETCCMLPCCVSDDEDLAVAAAKQTVLRYALHPAASKVFARSGHADQLATIADRLRADDQDAAFAMVDDGLARSFVVHGPPAACHEQVERYRSIGVNLPILFPMPDQSGDWDRAVRTTVEAFVGAAT